MNLTEKSRALARPLSLPQQAGRYLLALLLTITGAGHESFARKAFQAQVPDWVPMNKGLVVVLSGIVEIALAGAIAGLNRQRVLVGITVGLFFVLVFPGNLAQYFNHRDAFGLDTDLARGIRLLFQPVLVAWALWATGALDAISNYRKMKRGIMH